MSDTLSIACFDIETSGLNADFAIVLCAVVKELGRREKVWRFDDYAAFKQHRRYDDAEIVRDIITELERHFVLVAHNGVKFDRPFLNTRALCGGGAPVILNPRGKIIDPVQLARKNLRLGYNSLERVLQHLRIGSKTTVTGDVWMKALLSSGTEQRKAMDAVVAHCINDTVQLERAMTPLKRFVPKIDEWGSR